jgi:pimeloyl-ACP methyl ester carboxylesterase
MTELTATRVTSRDGTPIGYWTSGSGQHVVLVHGGTADHSRWRSVLPLLEPHLTMHAVDRRGRGASGDATEYAIEREFEDIAAVIDSLAEAAEEPVDLVGHSFGALCSLGAATLTSGLRRLVVYEPAGTSPDDPISPELIDRLADLLAAGRREDLLETFFREAVQVPDAELEVLRGHPAWPGRIAAAHTIVRELRAVAAFRYERDLFAGINVPTLVLAGGASPAGVRELCDRVVEAIPGGRLAVLEGQQHIAMDTAPELFATTVVDFLTGQSGSS